MFNGVDWTVIAAAVFGLFVVYFLYRAFCRPLSIVLKGIMHLFIGAAAIFLFNLLGALWGFTLGLNVITALIVGVMGVPGLGMLVILHYVLG